MRRLITVMIALLAMASCALAQDEFNVNTNPPATGASPSASNNNPAANSNPAVATCDPPYNATMEKLSEQEAQAQGQLRKDVVDCNFNHDNSGTACFDAANKKYWTVHVEVIKGEIDADANRQICNNRVHLSAAAAFNAKNKPDPCQAQYDQTMNGLSDQNILAQAQLRKDQVDCQNPSGQSDSSSCRDAAQQRYSPLYKKILNEQTDADTNRTICEDRRTLAQRGTQAPTDPGGAGAPNAAPSSGTALSGGVTQNVPATGANPSNPGGAGVPNTAPNPGTGLSGGVTQNAPSSGPNAAPANGPGPSETPAPGIAQVPKVAPVEGPVSAPVSGPAPMKPLKAGISKNEFPKSPKPISQPLASNSVANNQTGGATSSSAGKGIRNAGPGGGAAAQVPNGRPPVPGPLRFAREGADWIAKHLPGGESGVRAAADYSKQLKQPFEDRWTKPNGGIQEVGETVAGAGIGKVVGKLLGGIAIKIAQSGPGRAILSRFPKFPGFGTWAAKDAEKSAESAANRAGRNPQPPSRSSPPPRSGQAPQEQARDVRGEPNGPGPSGNGDREAMKQRMRDAQNQRQPPPPEKSRNQPQRPGSNNSADNRTRPSQPAGQNNRPQQQQARNQPQNSNGSNNSANNRGPQQRPGQNNNPQQQARNRPPNSNGSNNSGNNRGPQQNQPHSPQQQARNDPNLQKGAGAVPPRGRLGEPNEAGVGSGENGASEGAANGAAKAKSIGIPAGAVKKGDLVLGRWDGERGLQKWTREQGGITVEDEGLTPRNYDPSDPFLRQYGGSPYVQAVKEAATRGKQIHFDLNEVDVPRYLKGDCHTCGELRWIKDNWSNWNRAFPSTPLPKFYENGIELPKPPWLS